MAAARFCGWVTMMACVLATASTALAQPTERYEDKLEAHVAEYATAGNCASALKLIRSGLAVDSARAALVLGAMYEHGVCVTQNWDSAVANYVIAHHGGEQAAALRLAAGYAAPAAGPDAAAALWWLSQSQWKGGDRCAVSETARDDPDRFVAVLQTWTPARLATCNYLAGLMATIAGEAHYPWERRPLEPEVLLKPEGTVAVRLTPGLAQADVWTVARPGMFSAPQPAGHDIASRAVRVSRFEKDVRVIADRALARYPQPPGIDPTWFYQFAITYGSRHY